MHDMYDAHLMLKSTVPQPQYAHHEGSNKQSAQRVTMYKVRKCDPCSVYFSNFFLKVSYVLVLVRDHF